MSQFEVNRPRPVPDPHLLDAGTSALLTYEPYFELREKAFSLSADPKFFYKTESHAPAYDDLLAGIRRREGLVVLTGDIGTGKTTLCRAVLDHLDRKTFSAFVPDPFVSREDLLKMLLIDFGVMSVDDLKSGRLKDASRPDLSYPLYEFLNSLVPLQAFAVLIIDEAQNLSLPLLEEIRILSDLEGREKLLQVVLVGQLEFLAKLRLPQMRQVDQRVSVRCALEPLSREGVAGYIVHRLSVAGARDDRIEIAPEAFDAIYRGSGGVPRLVNRICDRALHRGYLERTTRVSPETVWAAIADLGLDASPAPRPPEVSVGTAPTGGGGLHPAPVGDGGAVRRGLFGANGTDVGISDGDMDLSGVMEMAPYAPEPDGRPEEPVTPPPLEPVLAAPPGTLGLGRTITPPSGALARADAQRAEPDLPLQGWLASRMQTLGLGETTEDAYDRLRLLRRRQIRKGRLMLAGAALAVVAVWAVGAGVWHFQRMLQELAQSSAVLYPPPPPVPLATPGLDARWLLAPVSRTPEAPAPPAAAPAVVAPQPAPGPYVIQVALFGSLERANRLHAELMQAGYRAYQAEFNVSSRGPLHQVLVGPYETKGEALLDCDRLIRQMPGYADARVAEVRPARAPGP